MFSSNQHMSFPNGNRGKIQLIIRTLDLAVNRPAKPLGGINSPDPNVGIQEQLHRGSLAGARHPTPKGIYGSHDVTGNFHLIAHAAKPRRFRSRDHRHDLRDRAAKSCDSYWRARLADFLDHAEAGSLEFRNCNLSHDQIVL